MTDISRRQKEFFMIQITSCMGGFLLIAGLSQGGIWASCVVVLLIIWCSFGESLFLKRNKNIEVVHWGCSDWILIAAGLLFIYASNSIIRTFSLCCMLISLYVNLYKTCYYEKLSYAYVRKIFGDLPILVFYNLPAFWRWEEPYESRRKRRSCTIGLFSVTGILACVILPLYTAMDADMGRLAVLFGEKVLAVLPFLLLCMILGIIPAMLNYSLVRGLVENIVLNNPERYKLSGESNIQEANAPVVETTDTYILKESVFKIMLWGMIIVNVVLVVLQISSLFQILVSRQNEEVPYTIQGVMPMLAAIVFSVVLLAIIQYTTRNGGSGSLRMAALIYIFTLLILLLIMMARYIVKISYNGIEKADISGLLTLLSLGVILCVYLSSFFEEDIQIGRKIVFWGTALFVLLSVIPIEYIVAEINVQVFINKLDRNQINEYVSKDDIDLEYLGTLGYDAVPALGKLLQISLPYEETSESVAQTVKGELLNIYAQDLNEEERAQIAERNAKEGVGQLIDILGGKVKYEMIGKRKISLQTLAESMDMTISQ